MKEFNLLWLKRDLRWSDHDALLAARESRKPLLAIYIFDLEEQKQADWHPRHENAQWEALRKMRNELGPHRDHLLILKGHSSQVIEHLIDNYPVCGLFSHKEHGLEAS
jgi:deoxyribodipyrimidine photo-lyase